MIKYLMAMGKQVPQSLLKEVSEGKKQEIQKDLYNDFNRANEQGSVHHDTLDNHNNEGPTTVFHPQIYQPHVQNGHLSRIPAHMANPRQFNRQQPPPNKYSPQYAAYVGAKPRAQASARIRLGGAF